VLARSNYKKTLNYSHEPSKELNESENTMSTVQLQFRINEPLGDSQNFVRFIKKKYQ
jgi:hypothetical protein